MNLIPVQFSHPAAKYDISVGHSLNAIASWSRQCLGKSAARIVVVSNRKVFDLYGSTVLGGLEQAGFSVAVGLIGDGERFKNMGAVEKALNAFAAHGLTRTDVVVALGGGVVGDVAGFAAAIHLRGVPFLQIPTTLLAMIDSSVGGKTGVNSAAGKNIIGAFHQPQGVLIDPAVLQTLERREVVAGLCEMIKHAVIADKKLFDNTSDFLAHYSADDFSLRIVDPTFQTELSGLISQNVAFKARIVAGDEREAAGKTDSKSRKILNFGHTLAHALEKVTDYKYLRHGEAVGYGILFAAELSKSLALCDEMVVKSLNGVVHRVGPLPPLAGIDADEVFEAFRFDKKNVAGSLQMVLIKGIGSPIIVNERDIPHDATRSVLKRLLQKNGPEGLHPQRLTQ